MTGKRVALSEIDPQAEARPDGHDETVSWREICRAEFGATRFSCIHELSQTRTCSLCGQVLHSSAGLDASEDCDYRLLKVILIGSDRVGKTSFLRQFVDRVDAETGNDSYRTTIGVDFANKNCRTTGGVEVKIQIWDTAGQARFRTITAAFYRGATGCVAMFDVSRRDSFREIERAWWPEFIEARHPERVLNADERKQECACAVVLVGIRQDLTTHRARAVTKSEALRLAQRMGEMLALYTNNECVRYVEANPANGDGVDRALATLVNIRLQNEARASRTARALHDINPCRSVAENLCAVM